MGSTEEPLKRLCRILQRDPGAVQWEDPREVVICRGTNGKLGFNFITVEPVGGASFSIVTKVKDECQTKLGNLQLFDRITHVSNVCIIGYKEEKVQFSLGHNTAQSDCRLKLHVTGFVGCKGLMTQKEYGSSFKGFPIQDASYNRSGSASIGSHEKSGVINNGKVTKGESVASPHAVEPGPSWPPNHFSVRTDLKQHQKQTQSKPTNLTVANGKPVSSNPKLTTEQKKKSHSYAHPMQREPPLLDPTCGQVWTDYGQEGIMSVTDIEVTMSDEESHSPQPQDKNVNHPDVHQTMSPPRSPMEMTASPVLTPESPSFPPRRCKKVSCDENSCLWHRCVLKLPHLVRWEDRTVAITLRKSGESFGFSHKSKQHQHTGEIFRLVSDVEKDGPAAQSGLSVGDLILSINTIPQQFKQKKEICFKSLNELKLQIQHPEEISIKATGAVRLLAASMNAACAEMTTSDSRITLQLPASPSTSPPGAGFVPQFSPTNESIPLFPIVKCPPNPETQPHDLPQARVFVFGSGTSEFVKCLLGDFINVSLDSRASCFQISMKKLPEGSVTIGNSESFTYLVKEALESCINVELICIVDDSFFHHCCSWLFTPKSIFILTVNYKRVTLSTDSEMLRLCNLAHTVRTSVPGACANLKLYVITTREDNTPLEEVQALFYTSRVDSLPKPQVIPITTSGNTPAGDMSPAKAEIFFELSRMCSQQKVIPPVSKALDMLMSHPSLTITREELASTLQEWNSDPTLETQTVIQVLEDLINTGNLIVTGSLNTACMSENSKEFVIPGVLFQRLSHLVQCSEKDRVTMSKQEFWLNLCVNGIVHRMEMLDMFRSLCCADPGKLLSIMEDLRLVFPIETMRQDSGFNDNGCILFPYFLEDIPFTFDPVVYEEYFTIRFTEDIPISCFYSFLSELSSSDNCQSFKITTQYLAHVTYQGLDLTFNFIKTGKCIEVYIKRSGHGHIKPTVCQQIQQLMSQHLPSTGQLVLEQCSPQAPANRDPDITDPGQSSDVHLRLPQGLIVDGNHHSQMTGGACAATASGCQSTTLTQEKGQAVEQLQVEVLETPVSSLIFINVVMHEIYRHFSVMERWELLAGNLGVPLGDLCLYKSLQQKRPNELPGKTFLDTFIQETRCTLRRLLVALLNMRQDNDIVAVQLAEKLWSEAYRHNHGQL